MKVIGTAGHIDHGKSTLVRRLTGVDPDRLAEEKRRGMTIDLGFTWLTLPSHGVVSVIDVPGHERFIKNMLAGVGGIDVALLVVSADEGVMPQTREHLDILDLLDVRRAVVALTKSDLVESDWIDLVRDEVALLLQSTSLAGSEIVPLSAVSGQGIDDLLRELDVVVSASPSPNDAHRPYLPVDRVFSISGFGTVVTGTLHDGDLQTGEEIELLPSGRTARIRGLQTHQAQVATAGPGTRVAVNLAGIRRDELKRGDVLSTPGQVRVVRRVDSLIRVVRDAPFPLVHGADVTVHIGAAERAAVVGVLGADEIKPGGQGWAQIRFREPIAGIRGQRFVIRLPAPARTIAGGTVVDLVPRHRRYDESALLRLEALVEGSPEEAVLASLGGRRPQDSSHIARSTGLKEAEILSLLDGLVATTRVVLLDGKYLNAETWNDLTISATQLLARYHADNPLRRGMPREELRSRLSLPSDVWTSVLKRLVYDGVVRDNGSLLAAMTHQGGSASRRDDANNILGALRERPESPPSAQELMAIAGGDLRLLDALEEEGEIVRVSDGLYFAREAYDSFLQQIVDVIRRDERVTVAGVRDMLGTSRKYALALLEHLDAERVTRRVNDDRVLGSRAPACA